MLFPKTSLNQKFIVLRPSSCSTWGWSLGEINIQGIPAFRDFTIHDPRYFLILFFMILKKKFKKNGKKWKKKKIWSIFWKSFWIIFSFIFFCLNTLIDVWKNSDGVLSSNSSNISNFPSLDFRSPKQWLMKEFGSNTSEVSEFRNSNKIK